MFKTAVALTALAVADGFRAGPMRMSALEVHNGKHLSAERKAELVATTQAIATPGKGITACDEGPGTVGARFEAVGIENTEENRRVYRQMLFEAEDAEKYLSGAILDIETVFQKSTTSGEPFPEMLKKRGIVPGVKPHLKVYTLPGTGGDTVMQGLDSLAARCADYYAAGCRFTKWRSPLEIDVSEGRPTALAIEANMKDLARFALISQDEGLVPIVEPDISLKGVHDLETAVNVNVAVQSMLYKAMLEHGVFMEGSVLKTNMVNPGRDCPTSFTVEEIAEANLQVARRCMPMAIPTINYLSGGQSLEDACARLSAMNKAKTNEPWNFSFSWSAAIQLPVLDLCKGKGGEFPMAEMEALYVKALKSGSDAAKGEYEWAAGEGAHAGKEGLPDLQKA
uniref:fructose-bisphosphate aldolase n=2 Tax=Phaeomonas parva TaxID=124430 RepID=A0A7S1UGC3_9STRA|mmetsp:Transcript_4638/g.13210  ORF Transcript_4638/g.13210 Transcript_4638/m.13210 type:complete len:396 (+) Transcript_4638:57-1244(+)|eukprot:CAMPEP_0118853494 /NCGR_PEP_ID=MMETSP1163-20130328/2060_1 /TAXON_ID=124430 /ORGANISM="Phaeomonas parva, Strain CCMP2877" /LENGTH=395 /DNA_ID=CAMNT_0006786051 /DNA_START=46 /DNA_END=1233 /DNA_ORIENTATION=-